jgi:hypothetical protein
MSNNLAKQIEPRWETDPDLTAVRPHFAQIAAQAERGSVDPETLDALLMHLARELRAVHRSPDTERALGNASSILEELDQYAQHLRERSWWGYKPFVTIAQVMATQWERARAARVASTQGDASGARERQHEAAVPQSDRQASPEQGEPRMATSGAPPAY